MPNVMAQDFLSLGTVNLWGIIRAGALAQRHSMLASKVRVALTMRSADAKELCSAISKRTLRCQELSSSAACGFTLIGFLCRGIAVVSLLA